MQFVRQNRYSLLGAKLVVLTSLFAVSPSTRGDETESRTLPPAAKKVINFADDIKPILKRSCTSCHANGKRKGGFNIDHIHTFLGGGDSGPAVVSGNSAESLLFEYQLTNDADLRMPLKGKPLTLNEIALLRAWIDQGVKWEKGFTFAKFRNAPMAPREVILPTNQELNPIDRFMAPYYAKHQINPEMTVSDAVFARRAFLDTIGLLPTPEEFEVFQADPRSDKRSKLVTDLLEDKQNYSQHWLTFWSDCLRNSYTRQYHGGGGKPITSWLTKSLMENKPYDQFVRELINPVDGSDGFIKGIAWRGTVNASQVTEMQAAQNVAQVFLGLNIKCASCHDSFINEWTLEQTYALASIFSENPMEVHRCNKPVGQQAAPAFLYPQLGEIDPTASRTDRIKQLSKIITSSKNGRLARTAVNRLWAIFLGRGLIEPVDEMDNPAWNQDLLDWLAVDLVNHGYDLKHTIRLILTSKAYQRPSAPLEADEDNYVFEGPVVRRLSAEQFLDALDQIILAAGQVDSEEKLPEQFDRKTALFDSGLMTGGSKQVDVNISNQERLILVVEEGQQSTKDDHANWVDPILHGPGEKKTRLTDLPWLTASSGWGKVTQDKSVLQSPLHVDGNTYRSGLGTHADSVIVFDITGKRFNRFTATVGRHHTTNGHAKDPADLEFIVYGLGAKKRAGLQTLNRLMTTLGRPKRDVIVTRRESTATTAQLLELSNGKAVADLMARGGKVWAASGHQAESIVDQLFTNALSRSPSDSEMQLSREIVGNPVSSEGIEDLFWILAMHPEFQLIH